MLNKVIGILPASGSASRLSGIPKFILPISEQVSLLEFHISLMEEVCDEVRVSTRSTWVPLLGSELKSRVRLIEMEPNSMAEATEYLIGLGGETFLVGMPDTYFLNFEANPYAKLLSANTEVALGSWAVPTDLLGKVGQILFDENLDLVDVKDKDSNCSYTNMWGIFKVSGNKKITKESIIPSTQFNDWLNKKVPISVVQISGEYIDVGTFAGLKHLYKSIGN